MLSVHLCFLWVWDLNVCSGNLTWYPLNRGIGQLLWGFAINYKSILLWQSFHLTDLLRRSYLKTELFCCHQDLADTLFRNARSMKDESRAHPLMWRDDWVLQCGDYVNGIFTAFQNQPFVHFQMKRAIHCMALSHRHKEGDRWLRVLAGNTSWDHHCFLCSEHKRAERGTNNKIFPPSRYDWF